MQRVHRPRGRRSDAAADAVLEAKAQGPGRLRLRLAEEPGLPAGIPRDRTPRSTGRRAIDDLLPRFVALLDEQRPQGTLAALELLAHEFARALDAAAWSLSATTDDGTGLRTVCGVERARPAVGRPSGRRGCRRGLSAGRLSRYRALWPSGARSSRAVTFRARTPPNWQYSTSGYDAVLVVAAADDERGYLLELYADRDTASLETVLSHARVLADYCVRGRRRASRS